MVAENDPDRSISRKNDDAEGYVKKIGILFGAENTFSGAVVDRINSLETEGIRAEFVHVGGVRKEGQSR